MNAEVMRAINVQINSEFSAWYSYLVEEENTAREWVARFRLVGDEPGSLLDLDRELGARAATAAWA
jgi:ferritin